MSIQADEPIALADMMLRRATKRDQIAAVSFVTLLILFTFAASRLGEIRGPAVGPFIPICATLWGGADLLTAFLLFTQFSVNGVRSFAYIGAAYAASGLLTIPYVAFFPGLFITSPLAVGTQQISAWFWFAWHLVFPAIIAAWRIYDPDFSRRFNTGIRIRAGLRLAMTGLVTGTLISVGTILVLRNSLPLIVINGHFTSLWSHGFAPFVFVFNAAAAMLVIGFARRPSLLQLWLAVALATSALDGALNAFAGARYSVSWYLGKAETLATASVLLLMLLSEVGGLYRRLGTMAIVDGLTGLRNRRSFDDYVRWTLNRRRKADVAFLLLDIDFFKQFNDRYGHSAGDTCLQRVAESLRTSLLRPSDLVARYGGEEFVVLLPETDARGARDVAERIRLRVEALAIPHAGSKVAPVVTLSIGVAHASAAQPIDGERLFAAADRALYNAKLLRNATVVAESIETIVPRLPVLGVRTVA
jgi:diguanylate cyclase (GGDEF)-like protein